MSSFRDLDGETPEETREVAEEIGAPDPTDVTAPPAATEDDERTPDGDRRRGLVTNLALGLVVVLLVGAIVYRLDHRGDTTTAAPTPAASATRTAGPAPATGAGTAPPSPQVAPSAASPSAAATTPPAPAPPGDAPEPTALPDKGAAALSAVNAFLPAWTLDAAAPARAAALAGVASPRLANELATIDPGHLPRVTGAPTVRSGNPSLAVVEVPVTAGTAVLTVQPIAGRWVVTDVSLTNAPGGPPTTPAAAA